MKRGRKRYEHIVIALVRVLGGRLPGAIVMSDLLPRIYAEVPGTTDEGSLRCDPLGAARSQSRWRTL
jgi:hypothetical protein